MEHKKPSLIDHTFAEPIPKWIPQLSLERQNELKNLRGRIEHETAILRKREKELQRKIYQHQEETKKLQAELANSNTRRQQLVIKYRKEKGKDYPYIEVFRNEIFDPVDELHRVYVTSVFTRDGYTFYERPRANTYTEVLMSDLIDRFSTNEDIVTIWGKDFNHVLEKLQKWELGQPFETIVRHQAIYNYCATEGVSKN